MENWKHHDAIYHLECFDVTGYFEKLLFLFEFSRLIAVLFIPLKENPETFSIIVNEKISNGNQH